MATVWVVFFAVVVIAVSPFVCSLTCDTSIIPDLAKFARGFWANFEQRDKIAETCVSAICRGFSVIGCGFLALTAVVACWYYTCNRCFVVGCAERKKEDATIRCWINDAAEEYCARLAQILCEAPDVYAAGETGAARE